MKADCAATDLPRNTTTPRLFLTVAGVDEPFLVDTGSDVSALPPRFVKRCSPNSDYRLFAVNGSSIPTYGTRNLTIDVGLPKTFAWNFIVAQVKQPILGADFLTHFNLLPDLQKQRLLDGATLCSAPGHVQPTTQPSVSSINTNLRLQDAVVRLLRKYGAITKPPQYHDQVKHDVVCFIETTGSPTYEKLRRLRFDVEQEVKSEYTRQEKIGIVRISKSQWAAGLIIKRERGKLRLIGDYRRLNAQTVPDRYPIPVIYDAIGLLRGKRIFSKIDLVRAFHNIPVFASHVEKTAVISPAGLYENIRMPFGLRNAPSTFQRFMHAVLSNLPFCTVYLDDILVFSDSPEEHINHLEIIFQRLLTYGLAINLDKCVFSVSDLQFLGYSINEKGFKPTEHKIEAIRQMQKPKTIAAMRKVLGVLNFYRQFTKNAAELLAPLQDTLKGHPKKNDRTTIKWTPELEKQFEKAREGFINYVQLRYQKRDAPLFLTCDASKIAVGAVLEQLTEKGTREPLGFFSRKLDEKQVNWPAYDLELYAVYSAVEHFETMIQGRELTIVTDHRPLTYLFTTKKKCKIERRSRYAEYISQYSTRIEHVSGSANVIADALSRPEEEDNEVSQIDAPVTLQDIAAAQEVDAEIQNWKKYGYRDQTLVTEKVGKNQDIVCSVFQNEKRPIVPKKLRFPIFRQIHTIAHTGLKATLKLIRTKFYWPRMTTDIRKWHKACDQCQRVKTQRHTIPPMGTFPACDRFEHVHMDLVGPLKPSQGYHYLCTFIDRATRWIEAIPLRTVTAETVARAFYNQWVSRYGTPLRVTTDRGPQFTSDLFIELTKFIGAQHIQTTAYHPQGNGMIERVHRRLKELLTCHSQDWASYLPSILLGLRAAPRDETGVSTAEMVYGQALRLPGEMYQETTNIDDASQFVRKLRQTIKKLRPIPQTNRRKDKIFVHPDLQQCKRVFVRVDKVRASLEAPYQGPYTVTKRREHYFELDMDGKKDTVSIMRLKPAYELDLEDDKLEAEKVQRSSILKKTGIDLSKVREGQTVSNTLFNSKYVYVNGANPFETFPITEPNPSTSENRVLPEAPNTRHVQIQVENPQISGQGANEQNSIRRSCRDRKPPRRLIES